MTRPLKINYNHPQKLNTNYYVNIINLRNTDAVLEAQEFQNVNISHALVKAFTRGEFLSSVLKAYNNTKSRTSNLPRFFVNNIATYQNTNFDRKQQILEKLKREQLNGEEIELIEQLPNDFADIVYFEATSSPYEQSQTSH